MQNGNYFIPGFAIPYRMPELLLPYAKAMGAAKADLLVNFGLQMETPNAQNWLLELDVNFKPTGRVAVRDLGDSFRVEYVTTAIGQSASLGKEQSSGVNYRVNLKPRGSYGFSGMFKFENGSRGEIGYDTAEILEARWQHDVGMLHRLNELLGLNIIAPDRPESFSAGTNPLNVYNEETPIVRAIDLALRSEKGQRALARYHTAHRGS